MIRIVTEKIAEGTPGEGYDAGYEIEPDTNASHTTSTGYYGRTREAALFRMFQSQAEGTANLARAVTQHAEVMDAIVKELAKTLGHDLGVDLGPRTVYEAAGEFGTTQIEQVKAQRSEYYNQLDDLHRCRHGRRYQVNCVYCPGGTSVGGFLDLSPEGQKAAVGWAQEQGPEQSTMTLSWERVEHVERVERVEPHESQ